MQHPEPMDVFYISYDEPQKEEAWAQVKELIPEAKRIDGIKGFNKAHQICAQESKSSRFFTIDGDNRILISPNTLTESSDLLDSNYVLSWSASNSINGLVYGNGGVKNWPKQLVLNMKSHEDAESEEAQVDFCFSYTYYQMPETLSVTEIHHSPYQAFRAGFREGMKISLNRGLKINVPQDELAVVFNQQIHVSNLERLKIWCTIGRDCPNGLWSIYGARLGCYKLYIDHHPIEDIRDYDWFQNFWQQQIQQKFYRPNIDMELLEKDCAFLGRALNEHLGLDLVEFDEDHSRFFKQVYVNRPRMGFMYALEDTEG